MQTLYKLTDSKGYTRGDTYWEVGQTHSKQPCSNPELCSGDVYHAYTDPNLALLLNPIHADIQNPRLFEVCGEVVVEDWDKVGCFELETTQELDLPEWYTDEDTCKKVRVQFAILCAEAVLPLFENKYPDDNRPRAALEAAQAWLANPTQENADAARAAAWAADAARAVARAAAWAADAAARAAAWAAARAVARAVARAAAHAAYAADLDFIFLANLAVEMAGN